MEITWPKRSSGNRPKKRKRVFPSSKSRTPVYLSPSARKVRPPTSSSHAPPDSYGYRIIDLSILKEALSSSVVCKVCKGEVNIVELAVQGLGSNFGIMCGVCGETNFSSCRKIGLKKRAMEINRRAFYAMRCLGLGLAGLRTFCGVMDLPPPLRQCAYAKVVEALHQATSCAAEESMRKATEEELALSDDTTSKDISASFDGTWMKRGHTSLHGVVTCIGGNSGKVLDAEVKSTHCKGCEMWKGRRAGPEFETWKNDHKETCCANFKGSSGRMEVESAIDIFERSERKRGVRYVEFIGDGDTQSYPGVVKSQPYGPDVEIKKVECVGHIQKRMGNRLRKHRQSLVGKKLSDGKSIGGRGRLTDVKMVKMTPYKSWRVPEPCDPRIQYRSRPLSILPAAYHPHTSYQI